MLPWLILLLNKLLDYFDMKGRFYWRPFFVNSFNVYLCIGFVNTRSHEKGSFRDCFVADAVVGDVHRVSGGAVAGGTNHVGGQPDPNQLQGGRTHYR